MRCSPCCCSSAAAGFWAATSARTGYDESLEASSQDWHQQRQDPLPWCRYVWGVLLRGYREFEQRIDAWAERGQSEALVVPRAGKRQLVHEACLRQLEGRGRAARWLPRMAGKRE
jgi:hypothetical protein